MRNRRGRGGSAYGKGRTERLSLAVSKKEAAYIRHLAELHGLTVAEYVRMRSISDPIERWDAA